MTCRRARRALPRVLVRSLVLIAAGVLIATGEASVRAQTAPPAGNPPPGYAPPPGYLSAGTAARLLPAAWLRAARLLPACAAARFPAARFREGAAASRAPPVPADPVHRRAFVSGRRRRDSRTRAARRQPGGLPGQRVPHDQRRAHHRHPQRERPAHARLLRFVQRGTRRPSVSAPSSHSPSPAASSSPSVPSSLSGAPTTSRIRPRAGTEAARTRASTTARTAPCSRRSAASSGSADWRPST